MEYLLTLIFGIALGFTMKYRPRRGAYRVVTDCVIPDRVNLVSGVTRLTVLFLFCATLLRANWVEIGITFTNIPATSDTIIRNGVTAYWTNGPINATTFIQTNGIAGSATNLARFLGANNSAFYTIQTSPTNLTVAARDLTFSISGNWATLTTNSAAQTNSTFVTVPFSNHAATNQTNIASMLVTGLASTTNAFPTNAAAMTNYLSLGPQSQTASNKDFNVSTLRNSTLTNTVLTNIIRANVGDVIATNLTAYGGSASNLTLVNLATASGTIGSITNGASEGLRLTNAAGEFLSSKLTNALLDRPQLTNASGTLIAPVTFSDGGVAGASILITNQAGISPGLVIDNGAAGVGSGIAFYWGGSRLWTINAASNAFTIQGSVGNCMSLESSTITLGEAGTISVDVANKLSANSITNSYFTGTNRFDGAISLTASNATGMANGDVLLDLSPRVSDVELSGNTATINVCGIKNGYGGWDLWLTKTNQYNVVVRNLSGAAGTAASERIFTGTGADVTLTNTPCMIHLRYRASMSAWILDRPN